ncbi:MAG TPA: FAD-dependent oxidoreductase [Candidatus Polarisedimenticolia bacterium]|jgi:protoporphyrinogen oxidase|nr:FAD-dependent oxidoreductase [Candidatus Polarisedimenticolia bacterium]
MSDSCPVVILGAGLTGLSAAYHLRTPSVVLEREREVGGLARTHSENGFTFDCTGHLLHLRDPRVQSLVDAILPGAFARHERRAMIYSNKVFTPYPFQANLHGLPPEVVQECVGGFVEALVRRAAEGEPDMTQLTFREWASRTFGAGIARHFMVPYNTKLWRTDLDEIECGWVSWSIPRPALKEVLDGAFGATVRGLGYNPVFLYPRRGGISALPEALARRGTEVRLNETVEAVDARARVVRLAGGREVRYEALVSTLPLDHLLRITRGLDGGLPEVGARLRAVRVLNISLGVDRDPISGAHWIYFPEPEFSFYRVGFPANLSPSLAPRGCSSLYVERSLLRDEPFEEDEVVGAAVDDLRRAGILWKGDRVVYRRVQVLDPAYVIYDRFRAGSLPRVHETLQAAGIHSAGRFGSWEYSSMEGAIQAGMELAGRLDAALGGGRRARRACP